MFLPRRRSQSKAWRIWKMMDFGQISLPPFLGAEKKYGIPTVSILEQYRDNPVATLWDPIVKRCLKNLWNFNAHVFEVPVLNWVTKLTSLCWSNTARMRPIHLVAGILFLFSLTHATHHVYWHQKHNDPKWDEIHCPLSPINGNTVGLYCEQSAQINHERLNHNARMRGPYIAIGILSPVSKLHREY